jgi:multiple sugar transport system permease protein
MASVEALRGVAPRKRATPQRRRQTRKTYVRVLLYMSPWILGFLIFTLYPILSSLYFSFTHYDILSTPVWTGLENYKFMFTKDPLFWASVRNTIWIVAFGVPLRIAFAILTATLLTRPKRGVKVYRTIMFLPTLAPAVAAALAFLYLFNPATGPIDHLLSAAGWQKPPLWFHDPTWSKPGLLILGLWGVGDAMIIFLAGLLDVPRQLYEAADIEGASFVQKFRLVTLPMISPVIFFSLVIGVIQGFQYFTEAYVTSFTLGNQTETALGNPQNSLLFFTTHLYQAGWVNFQMGYASALAWVLLAITLICTIVIIKTSNRWVFYQGGAFR